MDNNKTELTLIHSLKELSPLQRKEIARTENIFGGLFVLNYVLVILCAGFYPDSLSLSMDVVISLIFLSVFAFVTLFVGFRIGFYMKLADLGFAFVYRRCSSDYYQAPQSFSSSDASYHTFSSFQGSSSSINPSSGLPMSGSSGMDISGNPYGTRSW